jgi:predicted  nucleic acid-binding Zn-ribbon protein
MPHQCLTCGETFADGSEDLLQGCPGCEGTQFFFTEEPLDEEEREELKDQSPSSGGDVLDELPDAQETTAREMLEALAEEAEGGDLDGIEDLDDVDVDADLFSRDAWEDWIRLRGDDEDDEEDVQFEALTAEEEKDQLRESEAVQVSLEDVQETAPPDADEAEPPSPAPNEPEGEDDAKEVPAEARELLAGEATAENRPSTLNIEEPGQYEIDVERLMEDSPVIVERDGSFVIHLPSVFDRGPE